MKIGIALTSFPSQLAEDCFSNDVSYHKIDFSIKIITSKAFENYKSFTQIIIPSSVTQIGKYAFSNCASLEQLTIPSSITQIEDFTFKGCTSLKQIKISSSITKIGVSSFNDCSSLTEITIHSSITYDLESKLCQSHKLLDKNSHLEVCFQALYLDE